MRIIITGDIETIGVFYFSVLSKSLLIKSDIVYGMREKKKGKKNHSTDKPRARFISIFGRRFSILNTGRRYCIVQKSFRYSIKNNIASYNLLIKIPMLFFMFLGPIHPRFNVPVPDETICKTYNYSM